MNVRLYDGTVRCAEHMDASTFQGLTSDPCTYCPDSDTRSVNVSKIDCDWCAEPATWKINTEFALNGHQNACTAHGTEWFPKLFPESDTTPIEKIIESAISPVGVVQDTPRPWYPLMSHRNGLRANDLVSLASALWILALEGGTARPAGYRSARVYVGGREF